MPTLITARRLLTDIGSVEFPVLIVDDDGTITDISSDPAALMNEEDTLSAAFFDQHIHGALGHDVMSATPAQLAEMQRFLASRGVAQFLPTTVTAPIEPTLRALDALANAIEAEPQPLQARPIGIHLEGPFLSHAKRGVHPEDQLQEPSIALFDQFQQAARGHIRLLTIAPELRGAPDLIAHATQQGVRCSMGHTNATEDEAIAGLEAGATSATHTFNAMRALDHREPGVLGVVLDDARLYAELICDGVHVAPEVVRLWLRAKGAERAILVTDAMSAAGMPDGEYKLGELDVTVANGRAFLSGDASHGKETLAGSVLTMDRAVANVRRFTGCSLAVATRLTSHNPAAMIGRPELTRVASGSMANLNRFDAHGHLIATYIRGEIVN
ncbi:MAG TPA: N-acetylglucosamine-6-phosphate deacetylase [Candidatus Aquilonibacter sp.]|nr:N-acetylglucosamine-6-phosphate deacetylase [Candidatus Aquilonibacter sp.]